MSYYTVTVREVEILGYIWMPSNVLCTQVKKLTDYDVKNIMARGEGFITRDAVEDWLGCNAGDFSKIVDFHADIADIDIPWNEQDNEYSFGDIHYQYQ